MKNNIESKTDMKEILSTLHTKITDIAAYLHDKAGESSGGGVGVDGEQMWCIEEPKERIEKIIKGEKIPEGVAEYGRGKGDYLCLPKGECKEIETIIKKYQQMQMLMETIDARYVTRGEELDRWVRIFGEAANGEAEMWNMGRNRGS